MAITQANVDFMWHTVIGPREGDVYVFGGSLNPDATMQGTDCSGAVSEAAEADEYGPQMNWLRQFWTGTFAGASPGDTGPFGGVGVTSDWVCISGPDAAPPGAAMVVAVLQLSDPSEAHMVCKVLDNNNVTGFGGPGVYVGIESGGSFTDAQGNSTLHVGPEATSVDDSMFNQWFATGPIIDSGVPPVVVPVSFNPVSGVDFSGGRISGANLKAAGYGYACRYVFDGSPELPYKLLTKDEADDLLANGVGPVSNFESSGVDAVNGFNQGAADASEAQDNHTAAGGPPDRPIYFSMDWDEAPGDDAGVFAYFQGIASVIGLGRTGAYGGYWIIKRLFDAGLITWGWQANAWSSDPNSLAPVGPNQNYLDPRANILQLLGQATIDGVQCDTDIAYTADFGQWNYVAPQPPTPSGGSTMDMTTPVPSQSPFRLDDGNDWTPTQLVVNDDGFVHPMYVQWAAQYGQSWAVAVLQEVAALTDPARSADVALAQAIIASLPSAPVVPGPVIVADDVIPTPAPVVVASSSSPADAWLKGGITVLGGAGAVGTWVLEAFGNAMSPGVATGISSAIVILSGLAAKLVTLEQRLDATTGKVSSKLKLRRRGA